MKPLFCSNNSILGNYLGKLTVFYALKSYLRNKLPK